MPGELAIGTVTVMEIGYGLVSQPAARERYGTLWAALRTELNVLDYQTEDAQGTARLRQHLRQAGTPISPYNLQLAATALARSLSVVTNNTHKFTRVPGLTYEDWRVPDTSGT